MYLKNIFLLLILLLTTMAEAQNNQEKPCSSPKAREFDFWIGEWNVTWKDTSVSKPSGSNSIKVLWDGCVIEENFNGTPGTPLIGRSYSVYKPDKNKWYQTWIDNQGAYIPFEGEYKDGSMILVTERTNNEGKKILMRMVYFNIEKNSLDWNWERSDDNGNTWQALWKIHYTRK